MTGKILPVDDADTRFEDFEDGEGEDDDLYELDKVAGMYVAFEEDDFQ